MECTRCHRVLGRDDFSLKNVKKNLYYVNCNKCREKVKRDVNKAANEKMQYEDVKQREQIECACGKTYIAFRDYHILRHNSTKWHTERTRDI